MKENKMKKLLNVGILTLTLITTNAFAKEDDIIVANKPVEVIGNAVIIQEENVEYIIPIFNVVGIFMKREEKKYGVRYYGYYSESTRVKYINKSTYEMLKRLLIKREQ